MVAGNWTFVDGARTDLLDGTFDIDAAGWKMALFDSAANVDVTDTTYTGLTNEESNAGYTTGGASITFTLSGTSTVTVDISTDPQWTASGGDLVYRWQVIYFDDASDFLLCFSLADNTPGDVTVTSGNTLTVAANASGVFTLA